MTRIPGSNIETDRTLIQVEGHLAERIPPPESNSPLYLLLDRHPVKHTQCWEVWLGRRLMTLMMMTSVHF